MYSEEYYADTVALTMRRLGLTNTDLRRIVERYSKFFDSEIRNKKLGSYVQVCDQKIKDSANVPTYVLEYLLGTYCTSDDPEEVSAGIEQVKRILADNYVRPDEAEQIKAKIKENGNYTVIDKISVYRRCKNKRQRYHQLFVADVFCNSAFPQYFSFVRMLLIVDGAHFFPEPGLAIFCELSFSAI